MPPVALLRNYQRDRVSNNPNGASPQPAPIRRLPGLGAAT